MALFRYSFGAPVESVLCNPEKQCVIAAVKGIPRVLALEKGKKKNSKEKLVVVQLLKGHSQAIRSMCMLQDSLVTASNDCYILFWDFSTKREDRSVIPVQSCNLFFHGHSNSVKTVCTSPNQTMLCSGSADTKVIVWNLPKYLVISDSERPLLNVHLFSTTLTMHTDSVNTCIWNGDSSVISGSDDCDILIWDINAKMATHSYSCDDPIESIDNFDSNIVAFGLGGVRGILGILDLRIPTGGTIKVKFGEERPIRSLKCHSGGSYIVTGGRNAVLWDVRSLNEPVKVDTILDLENNVQCVDWWTDDVLAGCGTSLVRSPVTFPG